MFKRVIWSTFFILTLFLIIFFSGGFIKTLYLTSSEAQSNIETTTDTTDIIKQEKSNNQNDLLLIGDSITMGIGSESAMNLGQHYAAIVKENSGEEINVINHSIAGSKTTDWIERINDPIEIDSIASANVIFLSIGGNNIKELLEQDSIDLILEYENALAKYLKEIKSILDTIHVINPEAHIIFIGLYNPYGETISQQKIQLSLRWAYETKVLLTSYSNMIYIPLFDLFHEHLNFYLSIDNFHPNDAGYSAIVNRIYNVIGD